MNETSGFGGFGMWVFALLILMMMGGGSWFGDGRPIGPAPATQEAMTAGLNNQAIQSQLQQISLSSANNNYETARLISQQTGELIQQNNTNLINAIQGFNTVNQNIQNQTNVLGQQLMALDAKMSQCCCDIKTQMLQNRLDDAQAALVTANGTISNLNQSQYILGQLGRFVAWPSSGTQPATTAAG